MDQTRVFVDEPLTLTISVSGKNLNEVPEPSLPPLNDFLIVGRTSSTSSNISIVNGQFSSSQTIQYIYQLQPRQTGQFVIGAATVAYNGRTYRTTPITVEVGQGAAGGTPGRGGGGGGRPVPLARPNDQVNLKDDLFVRAVTDKKQAYLGEQVTVTYKLFTRVELANVQYDRLPSFTGFWMEEMYSAQHLDYSQEVIDGKRYATAVLKQIALFPTVTGEQTIEPLSMVCDVPVAARRSLLDSFLNDPFDPFFTQTRRVTIQTTPQTVQVLPLPTQGQPSGFNGAVGRFSITSAVDHARLEVSQPLTLTVTVSGEGNLKTLGDLALPDLSAFKRYASESKDDLTTRNLRVAGKKTYSYVLIPVQPGALRIDAIPFVYFDPAVGSYKTASTNPITVTVAPGAAGSAAPAYVSRKTDVTQIRQDIQYIKPETVDLGDQGDALYRSAWYILLHLIPVAAVVAALRYRSHADRLIHDVGYARGRRAYGAALHELQKAERGVKHGQFVQAFAHIAHALYRYIGDKYNQPTAGLTTQQIADLLAARGIEEDVIRKVRQCLEASDMARFAPVLLTSESTGEIVGMARNVIDTIEQRLSKTT